MKIFQKADINLKMIICVIVPVTCAFIAFLMVSTFLLNARIERLFTNDLIPFFNSRLAEMEQEAGRVLSIHSEENRKSFETLYSNQMKNLAKALAEAGLPLAEAFDYEGMERLLAEHLLKMGDTKQFIRAFLENTSSPTIEKGSFPDDPMTFFHVVQSDFGYVKIELLVSRNPLTELFHREDERMADITGHIRKIGGKISASISSQSKSFKTGIMKSLYQEMGILGAAAIIIISLGLFTFIKKIIIKPINGIVSGLKDISDEEFLTSSHLSSASLSMAKAAESQTFFIENTAASVQKMAVMIKQNADNADNARKMTQETFLIREKVNAQMRDMSTAIDQIAETGKKTKKIIKTIDEIAFQTKLLALNAAVEAAHAGNAGEGFGVIAEEVKNLAMKSAGAAQETSDMIENMVRLIEQGSRLTHSTQDAFKENIEIAARVGRLVDEIAGASGEQAHHAEQITRAMSDADRAVQQNAVTAEENAAIAGQMNQNAGQIKIFVTELSGVLAGKKNNS